MNLPAWNLDSEYTGIASNEFQSDWREVKTHLERLSTLVEGQDFGALESEKTVAQATAAFAEFDQASILMSNLHTYVQCLFSVDAEDAAARSASSELEDLYSRLSQLITPLENYLQRCPDDVFQRLLAQAPFRGHEFKLSQDRLRAQYLLTNDVEEMIQALNPSGHQAWGNLYGDLTGRGLCQLRFPDRIETVGLAEAKGMLYGTDEPRREIAWLGLQAYWTEHKETAGAILNALAGWRLEIGCKRSHSSPTHFLDLALFENRISAETLSALMETCRASLPQIQRAARLMARAIGKVKLDPWDLNASLAPRSQTHNHVRDFDSSMRIVRDAFMGIHPEMGEFADLAVKKQWIEARMLPKKAGGAHCTSFAKSGEPRVFQTYLGSFGDLTTLAHELGHAFHAWVMRDLPVAERNPPSTLAESASTFAEFAVGDALFRAAANREERLEVAWSDVASALVYLLNIPVRFEFEKSFYELRGKGFVSTEKLCELMDQTWKVWYGSTLSKNDQLFWASKEHFSFAGANFYNFPYAFGYLFSSSLFGLREKFGKEFFPLYRSLLRDTGRMTAEDLVMKYFKVDIREKSFWQGAIDIAVAKIDRFEAALNESSAE